MNKTETIAFLAEHHPQLHRAVQYGQISVRSACERVGIEVPRPSASTIPSDVAPGTIYRSSWGYEQTNIDYFEVTKTTPKTLELRPISQRQVAATSSMSAYVEPLPGTYTGPAFRCRIAAGSTNAVKINTCSYAYPWTGNPDHATYYA